MAKGGTVHLPVMPVETLERLCVRAGGTYVDATLGGGGHAAEILRLAGDGCRFLGIDRDGDALERTRKRLAQFGGDKVFVHGNHGDFARIADENGFTSIDGILIDTGISSDQLDTPERGFSFRSDGPLDMRMDQDRGETAADLIARMDVDEMADIFRRYGEEPRARHVARAIEKARSFAPITTTGKLAEILFAYGEEKFARGIAHGIVTARESAPINTTGELADIVAKSLGAPGRSRGHHPATRVFQALRMAVNGELEALEAALEAAIARLAPGGRIAVITFESLSDRLVKQCFVRHEGRDVSLQQGGSRWEGVLPRLVRVDRHAVTPGKEEIAANPRARSAKLRAAFAPGPEEAGGDLKNKEGF